MPERALLAAILLQAWRDAHNTRSPALRAEALHFLAGPGAEAICDWLDVNVEYLRYRLAG